jgi:hypothetical protein
VAALGRTPIEQDFAFHVNSAQLISCEIHMIMGLAAAVPGQSGRNRHARARREGWERLR